MAIECSPELVTSLGEAEPSIALAASEAATAGRGICVAFEYSLRFPDSNRLPCTEAEGCFFERPENQV